MNILICGGEKSSAIANAMSNRLGPSGVDFTVVSGIDEIANLATQGKFFDRAVIFEKGITESGAITDETRLRNMINQFAESMRYSVGIADKVFVFVAQDEAFASLVNDEILSIANNSVIIVKQLAERGYTVRFIEMLMTAELGYFPENLVYVPQVDDEEDESGVEIEDVDFEFDSVESVEETDNTDEDSEFKPVEGGDFEIEGETPQFNFDELDEMDIAGAEPENAEHSSNYSPVGDEEETQETEEVSDFDSIPSDFDSIPDDFELEHNDDTAQTAETDETAEDDSFEPQFNYGEPETVEDNTPEEPMIDPSMYNTPDRNDNNFSNDMYSTPQEEEITEEDYEETEEERVETPVTNNDASIRAAFSAFANRGISLFVTGCGGCGTSTLALNMANTLVNLGYSVLLVDMDTVHKSQSFITKDNYMAVDHSGAAVMAAVNSSSPVSAYMAIAKQGLHVLTMGLSSDSVEPKQVFTETRVARFNQAARMGHNFVIYDVPFNYIGQGLEQLAVQADNIILNIDSSEWGITKTLVDMCNIDSPDLAETLFTRSQIVFNRFKGLHKVFGKNIKKPYDITKNMDKKMLELCGTDIGYRFSELPISGIIKFDKMYDECWYEKKQYTDTNKGYNEYLKLITDIVIRA